MSAKSQAVGVSYIGSPRPNTAMYVTRKVGHLVSNLEGVSGCLVFAEEGVTVPSGVAAANEFRFSGNPLLAYVEFAQGLAAERETAERAVPYRRTDTGALVSETATVGEGAYLEPGVVIGPDVTIGRDATILTGAVIRHATIGDRVLVNEHAVIGANGFTMARDAEGQLIRIPSLGCVVIGDDVEIGAHDNISRGSGGDTAIHDHVKLDALVHVGHDVIVHENSEVTAGVVLGGYCEVGAGSFLGVGAVLRNRISVGHGATVGMGAVVTKSVNPELTVVGNPAHPFSN